MCFYYWPTCYSRGHLFYRQVLLPLWHTHHIHEVVESDHQVGHEEDHTDRMFIKDFQHYIRDAVHTLIPTGDGIKFSFFIEAKIEIETVTYGS